MYHFIPAHFSPPDLAHFSPLNCIVSSTQRAHFSPPNSTHFIPNGNFSIAKKHSKNEKWKWIWVCKASHFFSALMAWFLALASKMIGKEIPMILEVGMAPGGRSRSPRRRWRSISSTSWSSPTPWPRTRLGLPRPAHRVFSAKKNEQREEDSWYHFGSNFPVSQNQIRQL